MIWAMKIAKRPFVAKRLQSTNKLYTLVFFTPNRPVTQVTKRRLVISLLYKRHILKRAKKYSVTKQPKTGLKGLKLLHDNAPSHRASF